MSRHQAFRNYDYEEDLDEYEGEDYEDGDGDELSPEDRAQMDAGTAEVRAALGTEASKVSQKQIEEALWHYYYDVDKSVTYLLTKFIAPPPPKSTKKKNPGDCSFPLSEHRPRPPSYTSGYSGASLAHLFSDMPWLNVPQDRQTTFIQPTHYPRLGLLGGASSSTGKPSKLQALALARKKKAEEKAQSTQSTSQKPQNLSEAVPLDTKENHKDRVVLSFRAKHGITKDAVTAATETASAADDDNNSNKIPRNDCASQEEAVLPAKHAPVERAQPSAFAQALCGLRSQPEPVTLRPQYYPYPYMSFTNSVADAFSEPSPDDVVLNAQAKASSKKLAASTAKKTEKSDDATDGIKSLTVDDTPLPKSKNLNVLAEYEKTKDSRKKSVSFVVVGHVDAGKSTLMGRLLLELKVVDQRTIDKYRKEAETMGKSSFALAWVMDNRAEERERGVTIDVATNSFETEKTSFTILDSPGHRDFIPNMIAGASQADFAILVIDSSTGAFESGLKGQTREHALLIRSMGVSRVIVAVNKLDSVSWSQARFDEIVQQVTGFLVATGFQMKNVSFVPVSSLRGDNMVKKTDDPDASWYTGKTLMDELEESEALPRVLDTPLRMTISEVYRSLQNPLMVSGRLEAGSVQMGDAVMIQPSGEKAYVKSLELDGAAVDWAVAGQNATLNLSHIDPIHVRVGDIVCDAKKPVEAVETFTAKMLAFEMLMPMPIDVHRGRLFGSGQIAQISAVLDKFKGTVVKESPRSVKPGTVSRVVVSMTTKVPLEAGQRVVFRSGGETVAAGLLE